MVLRSSKLRHVRAGQTRFMHFRASPKLSRRSRAILRLISCDGSRDVASGEPGARHKNKKAHVFRVCLSFFQESTVGAFPAAVNAAASADSCQSIAEQLLAQFASFLRFQRERGCRARDQARNADWLARFLTPAIIARLDARK